MKRASILRVIIILVAGAGLGVLVYYSPAFFHQEPVAPAVELKMGGSSVVFFIMDKWKNAYKKQVEIGYTSTGSAKGVANMIDGEYQIGYSSNALTEEQRKKALAKGGEVVHVPIVLIAVVPIYNLEFKDKNGKAFKDKNGKALKDPPPLKFNAEVLAKIFLGKIDKWNHDELKELNKDLDVTLPDTEIKVVHRKDKSGTTFIFTDYLNGASKTWQKEIGAGREEIPWPTGPRFTGVDRNYGVAGQVKRTEGAIGYVESLHAVTNKIAYGAVENKEGAFVLAKAESVTAAAKGLTSDIPADFKLTNRPGKDAYPICAIDWAVCYQSQPASHQKIVVDFLQWATHDGQQYAKDLHYAPLSEELVQRAEQKLKTIKTVQ